MKSDVTVILYPPLNYSREFPPSQKERYCDEIECQEITKTLMIHDINIIAMIECCQERLVDMNKNYMQAFIKRILCTVSTHLMVIL